MPILTAKFKLKVSAPCIVALPDDQVPEIAASLNDMRISAKLNRRTGWRMKHKDEVNWTALLHTIDLIVSTDHLTAPPEVETRPNGQRDLTTQSEYLRTHLPAYQSAAREIANQILAYFKYSLLTPEVNWIPTWEQDLHNPIWFGADGRQLPAGTPTLVGQPISGLGGKLEARAFGPTDVQALQSFVDARSKPSLAQTLLSDAQTAWFEGSLRRAVLDLAICAEVMVKRRFFSESTPAGAAFDFLEDKGKISVRVLDLLDSVAEEAFGASYRKQEPVEYQRLDYLFRCRNKIAHRGELAFRDESGKLTAADNAKVEEWWRSVWQLKKWLDAH